ncbi:MAG: hypothetical protein ABMB14_39070 [Myxococcota bacterium]
MLALRFGTARSGRDDLAPVVTLYAEGEAAARLELDAPVSLAATIVASVSSGMTDVPSWTQDTRFRCTCGGRYSTESLVSDPRWISAQRDEDWRGRTDP